ncbi:MAG: class I SAM-dependent methyltransferase [Pseudonocardiaceae bacterium]
MGLGQRFLGGPHGHADGGSGGHIIRPRLYECAAAIVFLGQRRHVFDHLIALSGAHKGDRVLDVGCGTGYLTRRAAHAVGPTGRVVGVDPSAPIIAFARRVAPSTVTFHVAGGEAIPEPDASFDVVISSLALHHIPRRCGRWRYGRCTECCVPAAGC